MSRIRTNLITNRMANGAPTVSNGLVISGVTTSTTFSGSGASLTNLPSAQLTGALPALDGSNLTGLSGVSVANQADNRLITATGTTDALNGEANLTFTGSILTVTNSSGAAELTLVTPSANDSGVYFNDGSNAGAVSYNHSDNTMRFRVNSTEKIRITNGGLDPSTDGATDLGNSSKRFRDLYLSSGIFLGGTTSSNELEDYEEGTYVPSTNTGLTLNSGYNTFSYIKIGRCCTVRGLFFPNNNPSGGHNMTISLPFASYNYTGSGASIAGAGGSGVMYRSISGADAGVAVYVNDNSSTATFYKNGSNGGAWSPVYNNDWNSGLEIYVDFTYFTV